MGNFRTLNTQHVLRRIPTRTATQLPDARARELPLHTPTDGTWSCATVDTIRRHGEQHFQGSCCVLMATSWTCLAPYTGQAAACYRPCAQHGTVQLSECGQGTSRAGVRCRQA